MYKEYKINSLEDTKKLAELIAEKVNIGQVITLKGTLGAGKTYFTNCFINYMMKKNNLPKVEVASPTFNIVKEYDGKKMKLYHFDMYRIEDFGELQEIGAEDILYKNEHDVAVVEWPDNAKMDYKNIVKITIEKVSDTERIFKVER